MRITLISQHKGATREESIEGRVEEAREQCHCSDGEDKLAREDSLPWLMPGSEREACQRNDSICL